MIDEKSKSEATKKDWLLRFQKMLDYFGWTYADVVKKTGNSYNSVKNITVKGVPRNMRFAILIFEKMREDSL